MRRYRSTRRTPLRDVRKLVQVAENLIDNLRRTRRRPMRSAGRHYGRSRYSASGPTGNPYPGFWANGRWHPYRT